MIVVNGEEIDVLDNISLGALIDHLSLASERVAVELNREVMRRDRWPTTILATDDRVEIVHFVGGG